MRNTFCLFIFFSFAFQVCQAQTPLLDSLQLQIESTQQGKKLLELHQQIAREYLRTQPSLAFIHIKEAAYWAEKVNEKAALAKSNELLGKYYMLMSNYPKALIEFKKSYDFFDVLEMHDERMQVLASIAVCERNMGNYQEALKIGLKLVSSARNDSSKLMMASAYNNIGITYSLLNDMPAAKESLLEAMSIFEELDRKYEAMKLKNNIAVIHKNLGDNERALELYKEVALYWQRTGAMAESAKTYINIGLMHEIAGNYEEAMHNLKWAMELSNEHGNPQTIAEAKNAMASLYFKLKEYSKAEKLFIESINVSRTAGLINMEVNSLENLSGLYREWGKNSKALIIYQEYESARDSLQSRNNNSTISTIRMEYENEKQLQEIKALRQKNLIQELEVREQKTLKIMFLLAGGFLLLLAIFFFSRYQLKRRLAAKLRKQYTKINKQNIIIENKNKQITDSINYAKRIQSSILQAKKEVSAIFENHFILYQPKDIVSGDFYWFAEIENHSIAVAADCTGHGVPGAFMSIIGTAFLNEIVNEQKITDPASILKKLDKNIKKALHQEESSRQAQDGMDISICCIDKNSNTLHFAGAVNPVYIIENNDLVLLKGSPYSIGGSGIYRKKKIEKKYSVKTHPLAPDATLYLFSDGYMDQFGGEEGNKLGSTQFKQLLLNNYQLPFHEQKKKIETYFMKWKGKNKQLDDVLVIGIKP